jgi:hypothetical protein
MQPPARFRPPVTTAYRSSRHETSEWQVTWQDTNSRSPGWLPDQARDVTKPGASLAAAVAAGRRPLCLAMMHPVQPAAAGCIAIRRDATMLHPAQGTSRIIVASDPGGP